MKCECADGQCPVHPGEDCSKEYTIKLWRVDMDDQSGTLFCDGCADDAMESGVFTDENPNDGPDILDDDVTMDHIPDVSECRQMRTKFESEGFWPNVWHINERGNTDLLSIGHNGAKIVKSWV